MDEHTIQAVTNAGEMAVRKGRLPIAIVGSERFYGREVVLIDKFSDAAEGAVPLAWFSAVYVDTAQRLIRWTR